MSSTFRNLWSVWLAGGGTLVLIATALVAANFDAGGTRYTWGAALAPLYVLVSIALCTLLGVCCANREALVVDDVADDARAAERVRALRSAAPALAWSFAFTALALGTLIAVNVRADSSASWTPVIALALATEALVAVYFACSVGARQYWLRRRVEPPAWTRPIDAAVCCWRPPAEYDDDDADALPEPPHAVPETESDAPLYLYECGGSALESAPCCAGDSAAGALVAVAFAGSLAYVALVVGTLVVAAARPVHVWPVLLAAWIVAPFVLLALGALVVRASRLSRHRYARWSTVVALVFVVGVLAASIVAAAAAPGTSAHVIAAPVYAALGVVVVFHCCAALSGARTGVLRVRSRIEAKTTPSDRVSRQYVTNRPSISVL